MPASTSAARARRARPRNPWCATTCRRRAARDIEPAGVNRAQSSLATSAADEYAYVARDVRRIAIVGGGLVTILIVLWILSHALGFTI